MPRHTLSLPYQYRALWVVLMGEKANFKIIEESEDFVLILDQGPWHTHKTITNDAEGVVERMIERLKGRRLEYLDSDGFRSELLIANNKFAGYSV